MNRADYINLFHLALAQPIGLVLRAESPEAAAAARDRLYRVKAEMGLKELRIGYSPWGREQVLLVNKKIARPASENAPAGSYPPSPAAVEEDD